MIGIVYGVVEEKYSLNGLTRTSFGIAVYSGSDIDDTSNVVLTISDITSDKAKLKSFVELCNRLELSLIHIFEAVDDFIA